MHLIHSEEDEISSSSSHSYNSSSTATPTSSPTPAMSHPCAPLYRCQPHGNSIPGYTLAGAGHQCAPPGKYKHPHNASHPSSLQTPVFAVNQDHQKQGSVANNMVPLAQVYSPGSHLYEAATLIRSNVNIVPNCSMVHWGNVPAPLVQAVNSHQALNPNSQYDPRQLSSMIPMHNTMVHPMQYYSQNGHGGHKNGHSGHTCTAQHSPMHTMSMSNHQQYPAGVTHLHHPHIHQYQHPTHLPLPLLSSTLMPNTRLNKQAYNGFRSPEDLTPTNSIPIDSIYNVSPHSENNLIATTCLSTVSSIPGEHEYSTTLDAINLNNHAVLGHPHHPVEVTPVGGVSDTSSSSHPSNNSEITTVTESSSFDSSGTASSTLPLTNSLNNHRPDLPALPSRADRYRIYSRKNELCNKSSTCKRPNSNNNNNNGVATSTNESNSTNSVSATSTKSCDNLHNLGPIDNARLALVQNQVQLDTANTFNNNINHNGNIYPYNGNPVRGAGNNEEELFCPPSPPKEFASRNFSRRSTSKIVPKVNVQEHDEEESIYDNCSDT